MHANLVKRVIICTLIATLSSLLVFSYGCNSNQNNFVEDDTSTSESSIEYNSAPLKNPDEFEPFNAYGVTICSASVKIVDTELTGYIYSYQILTIVAQNDGFYEIEYTDNRKALINKDFVEILQTKPQSDSKIYSWLIQPEESNDEM